MFKTIVLATDLSPAWDEIVACAGEFKALGCSRVILTNVIVTKFLVGWEEMLRADVRPKLEAQQRQLEAQGLQVEVEMPSGLPAYSLNDIACRYGADLIVLGSHGTALGGRRYWGALPVRWCTIPGTPPCSLTCGLNRSGKRTPAACIAAHCYGMSSSPPIFPKLGGGPENLSSVGDQRNRPGDPAQRPGCAGSNEAYPPGYQEIAAGAARDLLAQWKQRLLKAGVPIVHDRFDPGHPLPAILQVLESQDISLIVMGTQGKGFITGAVFGQRGP